MHVYDSAFSTLVYKEFSSQFLGHSKTVKPLEAENRQLSIVNPLPHRSLFLFSSYPLLILFGQCLTFDLNRYLGPTVRILPLPDRRVERVYCCKR